MAGFHFQELFELGEDETEYRSLGSEHVSTQQLGGREILVVQPEALRMLAAAAVRDVSHLFRTGHLKQLRLILDDAEASENDRFVALEMLKNANVSAGMNLPSCQDTGTAIVIGKKGENVFTGAHDEEALAHGIYDTYTGTNLRYSQMAPITMYEERNTGSNLPAQIEIYAKPGDEYEFLFITKGGGSIVAIGSVNGLMGFGDPAYSAAKAGLISLTKSLAMEMGRHNIRANIVLPGTVRTPLWERKAGAGSRSPCSVS